MKISKTNLLGSLLSLTALTALGLGGASGCTTQGYCFADCDGASAGGGGSAGSITGGSGGSAGGVQLGGQAGSAGSIQFGGQGGQGGCEQTNGGIEKCDGLDNDCNGTVDDGFDLNNPKHCGSCANNCLTVLSNADPTSVNCKWSGKPDEPGVCGFTACAPDWFDIDKDPTNGCEYPCVKTADDDKVCNNKDDNCNGLKDEDVDRCTSVTDCGQCGSACVVLHGTPKCVHEGDAPCDVTNTQCAIEKCDEGFYDLDKSYATGCEYQCTATGAEICGDGIDNDCNGFIDAADPNIGADPQLGKPCFGGTQGECATEAHAGVTACQGQAVVCQGDNVIQPGQNPELCNGLDDDCDGTPDNNPSDVGTACGTSALFPCSLGSMQCVNGALTCIGAVEPGAEVCNGLDDNCNGQIDDSPADAVGECGQSNVGTCKFGQKACVGGQVVCQGNVDAVAETCNGQDDDCDGTVDNNPTDTGASCGQSGIAPCKLGTLSCVNGALACNGNIDPQAEACDGLDNDCNGTIDDNTPGSGVACGQSDTAPCQKGTMQCVGAAMVCIGAIDPKAETCDGIDNNCNGFIDDSPTDAGGSCGQSDKAPCKLGTLACQNGVLTCSGNVDPTPELCDGLDNDCNGTVDDNPNGVNADCGQTNTAPCKLGKTQCQNGVLSCVGAVNPGVEICDGLDNDCNGQIDDDPGGVGQSCGQSNVFPCKLGTTSCQAGKIVCLGAIDPKTETCNGQDDNCDGQIDNNPTDAGGSCGESNKAPCKLGVLTCQGGTIQCVGNVDPTPEICDGKDNDCDGAIDDNPNGVNADCGQSGTAPCKLGKTQCQNGVISCVGAVDPGVEICDGLDNDCNGQIDDNPGGVGQSCGQSNVFPCKLGTTSCQAGKIVCLGAIDPKTETCNGQDDNCDGQIDNNPTDAGGSCGESNKAPCKLGVLTCQNGTIQCVGNVDPTPELCDGKDNDCDGLIDDNPNGVNADCGQSGTAPCKFGKTQCQNGVLSCVGAVDPKSETCDGLDNDCNGQIDDNPSGVGQSCGQSNVFPCKLGSTSCQGGKVVCIGNIDPKTETCNGVDDDCDGKIDLTGANPPSDSVGICNVPPPAPPGATSPCKSGTKACQGGTIQCVGSVTPAPGAQDTCGVDANCDGSLTNQPNTTSDVNNCGGCGISCYAGAIHSAWSCVNNACVFQGCEPGYYDNGGPGDAVAGDKKCGYACTFVSAAEACNGADDNCNGQIDENPQSKPSAVQLCGVSPQATRPECTTGVTIACTGGSWKCSFPANVCSPTCATAAEKCDGLDNDCDGLFNENVANFGKPCASDDTAPGTQGVCRTTGTYECDGLDAVKCNAVKASCASLPGGCDEVCDGKDNDCDGTVDETFASKGTNPSFFIKPAVTKIASSLWIYSYEASRPGADTLVPGSGNGYWCNAASCPGGAPPAPAGQTLDKTKACSVPNRIPWFNVTPVEAEQTCISMGGRLCTTTEWQSACTATASCQWGYATRGAPCTSGYTGSKFCNLGLSFDFDPASSGDQDGLLVTASPKLQNCFADWSSLQGNTASTNKIFDITGNLREITKDGSNIYPLMGGAFDSQAEGGAACSFDFFAVDTNFKLYETGFRCCFTTDPTQLAGIRREPGREPEMAPGSRSRSPLTRHRHSCRCLAKARHPSGQ